jgi:hypothetical protein
MARDPVAAPRFRAVLRPGDARPDATGPRACGGCTLCCTVLRVDVLRKPGGVPCRHLRADPPGCGIHAGRPRLCRAYRCLWLQGGLDEEDRPDRLGAVLDLVSRSGVVHLAVREAHPGVADAPRLRAIVERFRAALPVRVTAAHDAANPAAPVRVLLPGGEERRVEGEHVTVLRGGEVVGRHRLPWHERAVRRALLAWERLRLRRFARAGWHPAPPRSGR